jgi:hypothetical protein
MLYPYHMVRRNVKILLLVSFILILLGAAGYGAANYVKQKKVKDINNFEECAKAGYPVLESYPAQCNTPDGRHFVQELTDEEKKKLIPPVEGCKDLCGDGICQEFVCMAIGCPCAETKETCPQDCGGKSGGSAGLANPASVNCVNKGGNSEIRTNSDGSQTGYCTFPDGSECEEWAFYRNQCSPANVKSNMGVLEGKVIVGPICPVERVGVLCPVPPEAYTSRAVIVYAGDGKIEIARQNLDETGNYRINLPPGNYIVKTWQPGVLGAGAAHNINIRSGEITELNLDIDTGIR